MDFFNSEKVKKLNEKISNLETTLSNKPKPTLRPYTGALKKKQQTTEDSVKSKGFIVKAYEIDERYGEPHPYDFSLMEELYLKVPLIYGAINKTVNRVIGNGLRVKSEDEKVFNTIDEFLKRNNSDLLTRNIVRDAIVDGTAFVEIINTSLEEVREPYLLKLRRPTTMFVRRDDHGNVLGYTQNLQGIPKSKQNKENLVFFDPSEIVQFTLSPLGDNAYGNSQLLSLQGVIENKLNIEKSMAVLADRKANAPIIATVGTPESPAIDEDINAVGNDLDTMSARTEWVVPHTVKFEALDVASKLLNFEPFNEHFENQIIFGIEVPEVILGKGSVPEGLALEQGIDFDKRIQAIRSSIIYTLKKEVLNKLLKAKGLEGKEYDLEFYSETPTEKWGEVSNLLNVVNSNSMSDNMKVAAQVKIAELLKLDVDFDKIDVSRPSQPFIPQNLQEHVDKLKIEEFVGLPYKSVLDLIISYLLNASFDIADVTQAQVDGIRQALIDGFKQGGTIEALAKSINRRVFSGQDFEKAMAIARTETVRATNQAFLDSYANRGVSQVSWVSVVDDRTDLDCQELDGQRFSLESIEDGTAPQIPLHVNCRCRYKAVI